LLAPRYRCILLNTRGNAYSPWGEPSKPASNTTAQYAEDVVALADALGIKTFTFVGFSMAGRVGQRLAAAHGHRLYRLVLVAASLSEGLPPPFHGLGDAVWGMIAGKAVESYATRAVAIAALRGYCEEITRLSTNTY
jgi:pimeloyl-ACP methyl ester carboxylesterase